MAGVKGRSGGARENAGGSRAGSGRKPAKARKTAAKGYQTDDPLEFLRVLMKDKRADFKERKEAAMTLAKLEKGTGPALGKKQQQAEAAQGVVTRSLAPAPPPCKPRLALVK